MSTSFPSDTTAPAVEPAAESDDEAVAAPLEPTALRDLCSHLRFWPVALVGVALDLWSKQWAFEALRHGRKKLEVIPHVLSFETMLNDGALFGIGAGQTTLFLVASLLALLLVGWMFVQSSPRRRMLQIALGGILAGALGNMYDRAFVQLVEYRQRACVITHEDERFIYLQEYPPRAGTRGFVVPSKGRQAQEIGPPLGYVRDFIKIEKPFGDYWPWVFNVADMLLVGGVAILAIYLWRDRKPKDAAAAGA